MRKVEGYGEVTDEQLDRLAKWLVKADTLYQDVEVLDLLRLTDLFSDEDWESKHPLADSLHLTLDHLFRESLGYPGLCDVQKAIADELQYAPLHKDHVSRMFLSASRGAGKSVILCGYIAWIYINDPNNTVLLMSSTKKLAEESLTMVRSMMENSPFAKHLLPQGNDADAVGYFDVNSEHRNRAGKDHSLLTSGITGRVTGRHPDFIILDDVEAAEAGGSVAERSRIHKKIQSEVPSMIKASKDKPARVIIVGTPHSHDSTYKKLGENYKIARFPAYYPDPKDPVGSKDVSEWMLDQVKTKKVKPHSPTFPERFDEDVLDAKRSDMGEVAFQLQFMLDTSMADQDEHPLKLANLVVMPDMYIDQDGAPSYVEWSYNKNAEIKWLRGLGDDRGRHPAEIGDEHGDFSQVVAFLDVSSTGADSTALTIIGRVGGYLYVLECLEIPGGMSERTMVMICEHLNNWKVSILKIETNYGGSMAPSLMRPVIKSVCNHPVSIEEVRVTGMKEQRILNTMIPLVNSHRLIFREKVFRGNEALIKQFTEIKNKKRCLKHDDVIDSLASCATHFTDHLKQDPVDQAIKIQEKIEEQEMQDYLDMDKGPNNRWWDATGVSGARRVHETQWANSDGPILRGDGGRRNLMNQAFAKNPRLKLRGRGLR